jgi:subtilisin family serine protease
MAPEQLVRHITFAGTSLEGGEARIAPEAQIPERDVEMAIDEDHTTLPPAQAHCKGCPPPCHPGRMDHCERRLPASEEQTMASARRRLLAASVFACFGSVALALAAPAPDEIPAEATWVFFTDKGLASPAEERAALAEVRASLTPRALDRRAKVRGQAPVDLRDVPVCEDYVEHVLAIGTRLRARSRWLNAISVTATPFQRAAIEMLPFVGRTQLVAKGRRDPVEVVPVEKRREGAMAHPRGARSLDYGECASQILPIQVDQLHDAGYSGAGVLVCLLDTGFLRVHDALLSVDVVAERDFIQEDSVTSNQPGDATNQHNHGTYVLSLIAGWDPGNLIGPAYGASYLLGKTEDVSDETPVEEDYWVEGAEWADSLGADIISSSLGYKDWYTYPDLNGNTAVTTIAADLAVANGIAVLTSAGNEGDDPWYYVLAPADGDSVLAIGAVDSAGVVTDFSSHGPTYDGRTKPDLCAMGEGNLIALVLDPSGYGRGSGTSLSCPLAGGVAALLLEAHPDWGPLELREALRETATRAATPDNDYGWGIVQAWAAHGYSTQTPQTTPQLAGAHLWAFPNPASESARLQYELPFASSDAGLSIYDVAGRRVLVLARPGTLAAAGSLLWDGRDAAGRYLATGVYFARLETAAGVLSRRVVRIR